MAGYKVRTKGCFDTGGKKEPLRRILTVVGSGEPLQTLQKKKTGLIGYQ